MLLMQDCAAQANTCALLLRLMQAPVSALGEMPRCCPLHSAVSSSEIAGDQQQLLALFDGCLKC